MANGYISKIRDRVLSAEDGTVFAASDFADIADTNTIRQSLYRLVHTGTLRRILNGIYEKPKYSKLLNEYVARPGCSSKSIGPKLSLDHCSMRQHSLKYAGAVYPGNGGLVLHQ